MGAKCSACSDLEFQPSLDTRICQTYHTRSPSVYLFLHQRLTRAAEDESLALLRIIPHLWTHSCLFVITGGGTTTGSGFAVESHGSDCLGLALQTGTCISLSLYFPLLLLLFVHITTESRAGLWLQRWCVGEMHFSPTCDTPRAVVARLRLNHKRQAIHTGNIHLKWRQRGASRGLRYTFKFVDLHFSLLRSSQNVSTAKINRERKAVYEGRHLLVWFHLTSRRESDYYF